MKKLALLAVLLPASFLFGQGGTTSSDIYPASTGQNIGNPTKRWNIYGQNLNITGTFNCSGLGCPVGSGSGPDGSVQIYSAATGGLGSDPNITINTITHALSTYDLITKNTPVTDVRVFTGADLGAQVNAAIAQFPTESYSGGTYAYGTVFIPAGTYNSVTTSVTVNSPLVSILCAEGAEINYTGTGDWARVQMSPWPTGSDWQAGFIKGCTVRGTSAGASGIHLGDTVGFVLDNVNVTGFSNGTGLWMDNVTHWTERTTLISSNFGHNAKDVRFTVNGGTSSFGYSRFLDLRTNTGAGQEAWSVENGALFYNSILNATFNVSDPTGTAIHVYNGGTMKDNSYAVFGECVNSIPCTGASLATIDTGGALLGAGTMLGDGTMTISNSGTFHIAGSMMPNNDGYRMEWNTSDNSLRMYNNGNAQEVWFASNHRIIATESMGFSTTVTGAANDIGISRESAGVLAIGDGVSVANTTGSIHGLNGRFDGTLKIADSNSCTMSAGTCSAQSLAQTYSVAPKCFANWTGSGTLTGLIKVPSTTTTVTPASSVGTDTAVVNWFCSGS